jgi:hypothetical protein
MHIHMELGARIDSYYEYMISNKGDALLHIAIALILRLNVSCLNRRMIYFALLRGPHVDEL